MIELLNPAEMAEADRLAATAGVAGIELMEAAGRAVADAAARVAPAKALVLVVCGPGNNGGDGFVAARLLAERGYGVRVLLAGVPSQLSGDAAVAASRWQGPVSTAEPARVSGAHLIVDALYGAGLARSVEGLSRLLIEAMNAARAPIVAVDLPSGVHGGSGAVMGAAIKAAETVTFFRRKPGHLLLPGRLRCGPVTVADIGIPASVLTRIRPTAFANAPPLWRHAFPVPTLDGHKYTRGHVVTVSGGMASTGAARLAARGALRAGAGLVTIASPREALAVNAAASLAIMVRPTDGAGELAALLSDPRLNALVIGPGCGVGAATAAMVEAALKGSGAAVLDADALTSFAERPQQLFDACAERGDAATVMTPHEGEFARLFGEVKEAAAGSKLERARAAARAAHAVVLLKGADTVVAAPDGRAAISENAPPWLATAGSGDVLAGMIAGLLAQGMPPFEATNAAAWLHGEAGNEIGLGLISEDLPEALPKILQKLLSAGPVR